MKRFSTYYGFLLIFGALFVISLIGFSFEDRQHAKDEHAEHCEFAQAVNPQAQCPPFQYNTSSFWDGFWENWQSEWAQLLGQSAVLVAAQQKLAKKQSANTIDDVLTALERRGSTSDRSAGWPPPSRPRGTVG